MSELRQRNLGLPGRLPHLQDLRFFTLRINHHQHYHFPIITEAVCFLHGLQTASTFISCSGMKHAGKKHLRKAISIPRNRTTRITTLIPLQGIRQHTGVGTDREVVRGERTEYQTTTHVEAMQVTRNVQRRH